MKYFSDKWYVVSGKRALAVSKVLAVVLTTYHLSLTTAVAADRQLKEGNRQFKKGNFDKALNLYEDGLIDTPFSSVLHYNAGDATMMKGDFPKAEVSFTEAAKSSDPLLRGASHYNRGNALYYQGKYADAAEAYKDSLRANPRDEDAKYNLGVALKAMKNPPPPKPGSQGAKSKPSDSKKDKQKQDESGQGQQNQPKPNQMSKEDAERLLSAAAASEKKKGNQQAAAQGNGKNDEDW